MFDNEIENFDREIERDCCRLDFWKCTDEDVVKLIDRNDAVKIIETVIKIFEEIYQIIK